MRFFIIIMCVLLVVLLSLAFFINAPVAKTVDNNEKKTDIINNISIAEILLMLEKMEKADSDRAKYSESDKLSMQKKVSEIMNIEKVQNGELIKQIKLEHSGIYLTFNEIAALLDITVRSVREMTLVVIDIEQLFVVCKEERLYINVLTSANVSGLLNAIRLKQNKKIEIMFEINILLEKDKSGKLITRSIDIQSVNIAIDKKFLEYGCYYIFETSDYHSVVSNIITNTFNNLGAVSVVDEGILFE